MVERFFCLECLHFYCNLIYSLATIGRHTNHEKTKLSLRLKRIEIRALELVPRTKRMHFLTKRWLCMKNACLADNVTFFKHNAWLVARVFKQKYVADSKESFAQAVKKCNAKNVCS